MLVRYWSTLPLSQLMLLMWNCSLCSPLSPQEWKLSQGVAMEYGFADNICEQCALLLSLHWFGLHSGQLLDSLYDVTNVSLHFGTRPCLTSATMLAELCC